MHKLSILLATLFLTSSTLPMTSTAENITDLKSLAQSLGAYEDHMNYPNISYYTSVPKEDAVNKDYVITGYDYASLFTDSEHHLLTRDVAKYGDSSFSTSVIETLVHNGVVKADELLSGVNKLSEINFSTDSRKLMDSYQNTLENRVFKLYYNYLFKSTSSEEKVENLIKTATNCMQENKYFLIMYGSYRVTPTKAELESGNEISNVQNVHSAVGIGIADGNWNFNDKTFDKCILTLDSANIAESNEMFNENTCIYVNSFTNESYVPAFSDFLESELHIVTIDNTDMLNIEGINKKSDSNPELSDIVSVALTNKNSSSIYEITGESNGSEFVLNKDNDYLDNYHNKYNGYFFVKADRLKINRKSYSNVDSITLNNQKGSFRTELIGADSILEYDNNIFHINRKYNENAEEFSNSELRIDVNYRDDHDEWDFYCSTMTGVSFAPLEQSFILESAGNSYISGFDYKKSEFDGFYLDGKVMLNIDDNGKVQFLLNKDNDSFFENEVEKGDVNCDGRIDASDSSYILKTYADLSVGINRTINHQLADFNGDGKVDASDASGVLAVYAERATS